MDGKWVYLLAVYMTYGLQDWSGWVSAGRGALGGAGAGLEVGRAPSAAAVARGVFVSGARHSPTARAGPDTKLSPTLSFRSHPAFQIWSFVSGLPLVMVGRLSAVVYACFSTTQKGIFVIL